MTQVILKPINLAQCEVRIVGKTPLIMHQWSEKAKKQMREKKSGKKTKDRTPTDPVQECEDATYKLSDGDYGFPAVGIKACIREAAHRDIGVPRAMIGKAMFVFADSDMLVRLETPGFIMREDVVRVGMGSADLRYRPEFDQWAMNLRIEYDSDILTADTIANMIERAGFGVGIGEWRPEKGGDYGRFSVEVDS
jgi:hypothetical protein